MIKLQAPKSGRYFIHHDNSIAIWNRSVMESCIRSRMVDRAFRHLQAQVSAIRQQHTMFILRDTIHGVAASRDIRLAAAKTSGAQAVHPGYGFLSENAAFSRACKDAGLVFIGPDAESIEAMGSKSAAKERMLEARVPCVPGYQGPEQSDEQLLKHCRKTGLPVMIKAAAGGGGRGMRLVENEGGLLEAIKSARSEAANAFGSGELLVEKAVLDGRHVEIQVFGDRDGNVVFLGERDCSIQRRNQKVVEEAPSPAVDDKLRRAMGKAAVAAARAVNYVGAGTVEFLLGRDRQFYFLEMNTRLQVEHPVTELVYGVDLVEWQLRVAQGEALPLSQDEVLSRRKGWAIEVRLCAEDPAQDYLPQTGTVLKWSTPGGIGMPPYVGRQSFADNVRTDTYLRDGVQISPFYDSMQAKVIAWGEDREAARMRLIHALDDTLLLGVTSNRDYLLDVLRTEAFASGDFSTAFVGRHFPQDKLKADRPSARQLALAAVALYQDEAQRLLAEAGLTDEYLGWHNSHETPAEFKLKWREAEHVLDVLVHDGHLFTAEVGGEKVVIDVVRRESGSFEFIVSGDARGRAHYARRGDPGFVCAAGQPRRGPRHRPRLPGRRALDRLLLHHPAVALDRGGGALGASRVAHRRTAQQGRGAQPVRRAVVPGRADGAGPVVDRHP
jgi:geranyl-CoA carboxylase alpha subunit